MTPKEALNTLDETVIGNLELKVVLSKALEKQIPKKPIYEIEELFRICPNCAFPLPLHFKFCNECGQALDWGDCE